MLNKRYESDFFKRLAAEKESTRTMEYLRTLTINLEKYLPEEYLLNKEVEETAVANPKSPEF